AETALADLLVVQQHHVLMARIGHDVAVQVVDSGAPALDGLQEDAATVAQHPGDAVGHIVLARGFKDAFDDLDVLVDGTADIEQANEHGGLAKGIQRGMSERNSRRRLASLRNTPRITELIILLSMSFTPRQAMQ